MTGLVEHVVRWVWRVLSPQSSNIRRKGEMLKKLAALILVASAIFSVIIACGQPAPTEPSKTTIQRASPPIPPPAPTVAAGEEDGAGEALVGTPFTVRMIDNGGAGPFAYDPVDLTFGVGEIVNFTFIGEDAFHTFTVPDLDIDVEIEAGETTGLDFVFETAGTYELTCIPHEALGMIGTITVQ